MIPILLLKHDQFHSNRHGNIVKHQTCTHEYQQHNRCILVILQSITLETLSNSSSLVQRKKFKTTVSNVTGTWCDKSLHFICVSCVCFMCLCHSCVVQKGQVFHEQSQLAPLSLNYESYLC